MPIKHSPEDLLLLAARAAVSDRGDAVVPTKIQDVGGDQTWLLCSADKVFGRMPEDVTESRFLDLAWDMCQSGHIYWCGNVELGKGRMMAIPQ